jgi:hypothetical protein
MNKKYYKLKPDIEFRCDRHSKCCFPEMIFFDHEVIGSTRYWSTTDGEKHSYQSPYSSVLHMTNKKYSHAVDINGIMDGLHW